jgi:hypothetical protein
MGLLVPGPIQSYHVEHRIDDGSAKLIQAHGVHVVAGTVLGACLADDG